MGIQTLTDGRSMELDGPDLFHITQERPGRPMHTLKVAILEAALGAEAVDRWSDDALPAIAPFRRVLATRSIGRPVWIDGGAPDLGYHVQHVELQPPGDERQLCGLLARLCSETLDRRRPLWRLWHVSGVSGGRDAVVLQVHHALADGSGSVALWEAMADGGPRQAVAVEVPDAPALSPSRQAWKSIGAGAREMARMPRQVGRYLAYMRQVQHSERRGVATAAKPFLGPPTRFNGHPEQPRACAFATFPLSRLREVRAATGATITEIYLSVCGGAVRRHLAALGEDVQESLTATVPSALPERREPYGNSVTTLYVSLHSDVEDPHMRLDQVRRSLAGARQAADTDPRLLPDWQRYTRSYRGIYAALEVGERRIGRPAYNMIVTSVRGPGPLVIAGVPVVQLRSLGPLIGRLGLNLTAWSYADDFVVGIHAYRSAADGLDQLVSLLQDELGRLGR